VILAPVPPESVKRGLPGLPAVHAVLVALRVTLSEAVSALKLEVLTEKEGTEGVSQKQYRFAVLVPILF
jgi:hypothetical protein